MLRGVAVGCCFVAVVSGTQGLQGAGLWFGRRKRIDCRWSNGVVWELSPPQGQGNGWIELVRTSHKLHLG